MLIDSYISPIIFKKKIDKNMYSSYSNYFIILYMNFKKKKRNNGYKKKQIDFFYFNLIIEFTVL